MLLRPRYLLLTFFLSLVSVICAQSPIGGYAELQPQMSAPVPGNNASLFVLDGRLYMRSAGLTLATRQRGGQVAAIEADVELNKLGRNVTYVTRHPVSGHLFFSEADRRGRLSLYEQVPREGKSPKTKRVKLGSKRRGIVQPAFSSDGKILVFASPDPSGFGGSDLWCSFFVDGSWSAPRNMGERINTAGDETAPFIYGNYLFFSSRGRGGDSSSVWSLYVTQLDDRSVSADSVGGFSIGSAVVQALPAGVNSSYGDMQMVVDSANNMVYWISLRDGYPALYAFPGNPAGFLLSGDVTTSDGESMGGVTVTVASGGLALASVTTGKSGFYCVPLQAGRPYQVTFSKEGCYSETRQIESRHRNTDLFESLQCDVVMYGFPLDNVLILENIFGDNADYRYTSEGEFGLNAIVRFLADNPSLSAKLSLRCNRTSDIEFNRILNEKRVSVLRSFFAEHLPSDRVTFVNDMSGDLYADEKPASFDRLLVKYVKKM